MTTCWPICVAGASYEPPPTMTGQPMSGDVALERSSVLCDLGRFDDAVRQLRTILATDPHNERGLCLMALAQYGQADYDQALQTSLAAISENPDNDWPYRTASLALSYLGRDREAQEMARNAVRLAPHESDCHRVLAEALASNGADLGEARRAADRAVSLAPLDASAHIAVASVAEADGRVVEAVEAIRRALAIDPHNSYAQNELVRLTVNRRGRGNFDDLARAADGFAGVVRGDPHAAVSRYNLDITLHNFLSGAAYGILLAAFVGIKLWHHADTGLTRRLPVLLLLVPAFLAARFVSQLTPQLRSYLIGTLRNPVLATAVAFDACAAAGLVAGALFQRATSAAFVFAAASAVAARLVLVLRSRSLVARSRREFPQ
jgi:tetratricopeptide (TPR) repeat protein